MAAYVIWARWRSTHRHLITLVFQAPSNVVSGTYTNTAYVGSASPDSNLTNNSDSVAVQVIHGVTLQTAKVAVPQSGDAWQ